MAQIVPVRHRKSPRAGHGSRGPVPGTQRPMLIDATVMGTRNEIINAVLAFSGEVARKECASGILNLRVYRGPREKEETAGGPMLESEQVSTRWQVQVFLRSPPRTRQCWKCSVRGGGDGHFCKVAGCPLYSGAVSSAAWPGRRQVPFVRGCPFSEPTGTWYAWQWRYLAWMWSPAPRGRCSDNQ